MDNHEVITLEMFEDAKNYWLRKLAGELNELNLPADLYLEKPQENLPRKFVLGTQLTEQLSYLSKDNRLSLYVILLTALKILLSKFTGQSDIIVASSTLTGSNQGYNKGIVFRDLVDNRMTFKELLMNVKQTFSDGCKNQYYPFRKIMKILDIEDRLSLFRVVLILKSIQDLEYVNQMTADLEKDLIIELGPGRDQLEGTIAWNPGKFSTDTVDRLGRYYLRILEQTLNQPGIRLSDICLITEEEKRQLLVEFNDSGKEFPGDSAIHCLFEEEARKHPDKIASVGFEREENGAHPLTAGKAITYKELNTEADRLAAYLGSCGLKNEEIIGIMADPSIRLITGMLAILKAGGAYLPVDSGYPPERIRRMLADSHTGLLLTEKKLAGKSEEIQFKGRIIHLDDRYDDPKVRSAGKPGPRIGGRRLAYVIYTSGSTGHPKGIMVEHRNVVRLVYQPRFIDLQESDRLLLTGVIVFDIVTFEIWAPLLNSIPLYLPDEHIVLDAGALEGAITANRITLLHLVPPLFNRLSVQRPGIFSRLRCLLVGGDVVRPRYVAKLKHRYPRLKILHMYGPSENTTFSTCLAIDKDYETKIPLGKPIDNSILYLLDENHQVQPPGIKGELCTAGHGVARGYLNNAALTDEKFIDDPYLTDGKLYKTGDIARWLPDGNIEFFERRDRQFKIRGVRVEIGEIENHLLKHAKIKETVVVPTETGGDILEEAERELCAYFTAQQECSPTELREWLSRELPLYMIPSYFIQLEQMPLTPNGKIDRKALPKPAYLRSKAAYTPPGNRVQKKMSEIWAALLRVETGIIGIDTNFFDIGGHSLNATIMTAEVHQAFQVHLPLMEIFKTPTIRGLSAYIAGAERGEFDRIPPAEKKEYYPLSSAQKRIFFLHQLDNMSYNISEVVKLEGKSEPAKLEKVLRRLIGRHESFRTTFPIVNGEPVQKVHPAEEVQFDVGFYNAPREKVNAIIRDFIIPFDLTKPPLLKVGIIGVTDTVHILLVSMHHIVTDGFSFGIFTREFMQLYGDRQLPVVKLQYKDFSQWQAAGKTQGFIKKQEAYWLEVFADRVPLLELPTDFPRPAMQSFEGGSIDLEIAAAETNHLKTMAREEDTTLFMLLLAIWVVLLSKLSGQEDIAVGCPIAGRRHAQLQETIGVFINSLALRNYPTGEKTFKHFLQEVKQKTIDAFDNQDYPFEELVVKLGKARDASRNPLYNVLFTLENLDRPPVSAETPALKLKSYDYEKDKKSWMDLTMQGNDHGNSIIFTCYYWSKLFKKETIDRFMKYFLEIITTVIRDKEIRLKDISLTHDLVEVPTCIHQVEFEL